MKYLFQSVPVGENLTQFIFEVGDIGVPSSSELEMEFEKITESIHQAFSTSYSISTKIKELEKDKPFGWIEDQNKNITKEEIFAYKNLPHKRFVYTLNEKNYEPSQDINKLRNIMLEEAISDLALIKSLAIKLTLDPEQIARDALKDDVQKETAAVIEK